MCRNRPLKSNENIYTEREREREIEREREREREGERERRYVVTIQIDFKRNYL